MLKKKKRKRKKEKKRRNKDFFFFKRACDRSLVEEIIDYGGIVGARLEVEQVGTVGEADSRGVGASPGLCVEFHTLPSHGLVALLPRTFCGTKINE